MHPSRLPQSVRLALYAAAVCVLLYLCLAPTDSLPQPGIGDKWEHAVAWFVLAALGLLLSPWRPRAIAVFSLALAVGIELLQATIGFGRHGDWRDLVADALGVGAAFALAGALRMVRRPSGAV
jgi:VanZ family protein